jgi:hypothetical protein
MKESCLDYIVTRCSPGFGEDFGGEELTVMRHEAMICFLLQVLISVPFDVFRTQLSIYNEFSWSKFPENLAAFDTRITFYMML